MFLQLVIYFITINFKRSALFAYITRLYICIMYSIKVPSKKKKKKKLEDIDIIDSVQKHLAHIRKLQESADRALGENPGDEQPLDLSEKIQARIEQRKLDKQNKKLKKGNKRALNKSDKHNDAKPHVNRTDTNDSQVSTSEAINIDDAATAVVVGEEMKLEASQFKPYDYSEGTKKLLQGWFMNQIPGSLKCLILIDRLFKSLFTFIRKRTFCIGIGLSSTLYLHYLTACSGSKLFYLRPIDGKSWTLVPSLIYHSLRTIQEC